MPSVEPGLNDRLVRIEAKLDAIMVQLPRFVTWGRLGGAVATIAAIVVAVIK